MPGTILSSLHRLLHVTYTTTLGREYYHHHFIDRSLAPSSKSFILHTLQGPHKPHHKLHSISHGLGRRVTTPSFQGCQTSQNLAQCSEKGLKECGFISAPKVIACLTFLLGSKAASGFWAGGLCWLSTWHIIGAEGMVTEGRRASGQKGCCL